MVYPVNEIAFKVNTAGRTTPGTFVIIADMETFEPSFDNSLEEWTPMDTEGWIRRLMTGKAMSIALKGKRNYGDVGNDYVAGKWKENGNDANSILQIVFPDGDQIDMPCVINVTSYGGGDSTNVGALEAEFLSDGKPIYTAGSDDLGVLTFACSDGSVANSTKVASVSPVLAGTGYYYKINGSLPAYGTTTAALVAAGWQAYTLNSDIPTASGNVIVLAEVAAGAVTKAGSATAVVV